MQRKFRMKAQQTGAAATAPGGAYRPTREGRAFRLAFISPLLYFFGSIAWLIGAALACGAFPRSLVLNVGAGTQTASGILFIIASCLWIFGALVSILASHVEAAALHVGGRVPGIARVAMLSSWLELLGAILLLIGAALYTAGFKGDVNEVTAGSVLFLIGSFTYLVSQALLMVVAMIVGSVTSLMPEMVLRQRSWFAIASQFLFLTGMAYFVAGAAAFVTVSLGLYGALLWLVASTLWLVAFYVRLHSTWLYFVPLMAFATAAAATTSAVAGTAAQAGVTGVGRGDLEKGATTATGPIQSTGMKAGMGATGSLLPPAAPVPGIAQTAAGPVMPVGNAPPVVAAV